MDHFSSPCNREKLENPDFSSAQYNPSCGDSVAMYGLVKNNVATLITFVGKGCVIGQATASILTEKCKNKLLDEILVLDKEFVLAMIGVQLGPTRLKCALLPLMALQDAIKEYLKKE